ncbi:FACT complex subunit [Dimargaris xerosporica]|nr:FACT complex subunit [Dimargaris xerosporica]
MDDIPTQYQPIYLATPNPYNNTQGLLRLTKSGIGWKALQGEQLVTVPASELKRVQWMRVARQYGLKIIMKNGTWYKLDNFAKDDFDPLKEVLKKFYRIGLETRDLSLKGSNWGKAEFQGSYLSFNNGSKTIFEVPLEDVANTNLAGKNEVSLEFLPPDRQDQADVGHAKSAKVDEVVEMRFYIPGTMTATKAAKLDKHGTEGDLPADENGDKANQSRSDHEGDDADADGEAGEEETQNAAAVFYEMVKNKADLGQVTGDSIALFQEVLCLTPRGRYDIDMFPTFLRLRGKTYDYKINYESVIKLFLLSKPDDLHMVFVIGLDPPIRQGQTRYPFLVFQFVKDEEMDIELNLDEATIADKYQGKLQRQYSDPTYQVVSSVFRGLTGRNVAVTGGFQSLHHTAAIKCSLKANEGHIYPLQKCFLFIPKPPTYIPHAEIGSVSFSRVGSSATGPSRTFDLKFNMLSGTDYQFSSLPKEEYNALEQYLRDKKIKMKNELVDSDQVFNTLGTIGSESELSDAEEDDEDGDSGAQRKRRKTRPTDASELAGDFDDEDDEESPDEDFVEESSESDIPEEYDENYDSDAD